MSASSFEVLLQSFPSMAGALQGLADPSSAAIPAGAGLLLVLAAAAALRGRAAPVSPAAATPLPSAALGDAAPAASPAMELAVRATEGAGAAALLGLTTAGGGE